MKNLNTLGKLVITAFAVILLVGTFFAGKAMGGSTTPVMNKTVHQIAQEQEKAFLLQQAAEEKAEKAATRASKLEAQLAAAAASNARLESTISFWRATASSAQILSANPLLWLALIGTICAFAGYKKGRKVRRFASKKAPQQKQQQMPEKAKGVDEQRVIHLSGQSAANAARN